MPLADLSYRTPTQHPWKSFSHAISTTRMSLIQLSIDVLLNQMKPHRMNDITPPSKWQQDCKIYNVFMLETFC